MAYRVLIVDDDKLARNGLISIVPWQECGMAVVGDVPNGMAALEFLKTHRADLAVVDLSMPVLSGLDFIRESKQLYPDLQYVVLSFHEDFEYVQAAMRLGAVDYISKLRMEQEDCREVFLRVANVLRSREGETASQEEGISAEDMDILCKKWESLQWVYDDTLFEEEVEQLQDLSLSLRQIERLATRTVSALEGVFQRKFVLPPSFDSMSSYLGWLWNCRDCLLRESLGDGGIFSCILRSVSYIKENLRDTLKAETVAEYVGLSRGYYSTVFKKATGFTFNDFVRRQRVHLAKQLLREGKVSPGDVSMAVGYEDSKYFGHIFQEMTGMTCSAYWKKFAISK